MSDDDDAPGAEEDVAMDGRDYDDEDVNGNYDELEAEPEGTPAYSRIESRPNLDSFRWRVARA